MRECTRKEQLAVVAADPRWVAVVARDRTANGNFVYAVSTTGVYCRPACSARRPRPEHVSFFSGGVEAQRAGFRACLRCKPDDPSLEQVHAVKVAEACRQIEAAEIAPGLGKLAKEAAMSPYHFHRVFRAVTGVTPKRYAAAHRRQAVRRELARGGTVTEALYAAGYGSNSRFYAEAEEALGMRPKQFQTGGEQMQIRFAVGECSLGSVLVALSEKGVCAILLGDEPEALTRDLRDLFPRAELLGGEPGFEELVAQVVALVEEPGAGTCLPLDVRGTAFQQRVWEALRTVPAGSTVSYAELAERIGSPRAVRAVGAAVGANTLAIAIPCHRVIRSDGGVSGYRWGVERKRQLLDREGSSKSSLF